MFNYSKGFDFDFKIRDPITKQYTWNRNSSLNYNWTQWTAAVLQAQLQNLAGDYGAKVEQFPLNAKGVRISPNVTNTSNIATDNSTNTTTTNTTVNSDNVEAGREWVITFTLYRPLSVRVAPAILLASIPATNYKIENTYVPSPPVRGTYKMWVNNMAIKVWDGSAWNSDIPFDATSKLYDGLMYSLNNYDIKAWSKFRADDGLEHWFEFHGEGMRGDFNAQIQIDDGMLTGGRDTTKPFVVVETIRKGSNSTMIYNPIPNDMLFTPSDLPAILVNVGEMLSACLNNNCYYQTKSELTAVINNFTQ